jgi:hypothetical protein
MIIKERKSSSQLISMFQYFSRQLFKKKLKFLFALIIIAIISMMSFSAGVLSYRTTQLLTARDNIKYLIGTNLSLPFNYFRGIISNPEVLDISMKQLDLMQLSYYRDIAWAKSEFTSDIKNEYVPAKINYEGKEYKVKMRLRGRWLDHFQKDKWSFRIKVKGDEAIAGLKTFSIHHPGTRNFLYEWLYQKFSASEGLLNLRYDFVRVKLNGKDLGIYAREEFFTKALIERNENREGLLCKYKYTGLQIFAEDKLVTAKLPLSGSIIAARKMFYGMIDGKYKATSVFDKEKTAKYLALSDLFGAHHGQNPDNFIFYFNPISNLFEPIGYDGDVSDFTGYYGGPIFEFETFPTWEGGLHMPQLKRLFEDNDFVKAYVEQLELLDNNYIDNMLDSLESGIEDNKKIIWKSYPWYYFNKNILYNNLNAIKKSTYASTKLTNMSYSLDSPNNSIVVSFDNISLLPIEILGFYCGDSLVADADEIGIIQKPAIAEKNNRNTIKFPIGPDTITNLADSTFNLKFKYLGSKKISSTNLIETKYDYENMYVDIKNCNKEDHLAILKKYFKIDGDTIRIDAGLQTIDQLLIVPEGYTLTCGVNTTIDLVNDAMLISSSPLRFIGEEDSEIRFTSSDSTGKGLVVQNCEKKSVLKYVRFENLLNSGISQWQLTGAINFYKSPVEFHSCNFSSNLSEDYLNIIQTSFLIENSTFKNVYSDAFDSDFSDGSVVNTDFDSIGNDAIDISGSVVSAHNVTCNKIGDKGLSAGEGSTLKCGYVKIVNAEIGVASKDDSKVIIESLECFSSAVGITVFNKKLADFGPASVEILKIDMREVEVPYLVETESTLIVNDEIVISTEEHVKELLYGVKYGKSSK